MSTSLRHNEYYDMQETLDWLYDRSLKRSTKGLRLYELITSRENILLAYRNIKANTGSKTKGTDGLTIDDYKIIDEQTFIEDIRSTLKNYKPNSIRRVEIPKPNGKLRPLGIPTMRDRLIQQMFKQILEPICEARFHKHSYGFRPNRATHHAMARSQHLINNNWLHYVVDIDIQGFFDNVNHTKLLKQMYDIGIKDKRVLRIISKMLKAPIKGEGIPTKGTPQGGILSPLLSNIVLNELDWWISDQWESFKSTNEYSCEDKKYRALKNTNLKEMYIVRYADDFKIFTRYSKTATKTFHSVRNYLKDNLKLDISNEKSQITNLRKRTSDFLGFKIKATKKKSKYVANTFIQDKKAEIIKTKLRSLIKEIQKSPTPKTVNAYNIYVMGIKNYYKYATHINKDFNKIAYQISRTLYNRLKSIGKYEVPIKPNGAYLKFNRGNSKTYKICDIYLHPLMDIQTENVMNFKPSICNYTKDGRDIIHNKLKPSVTIEIHKIAKTIYEHNSVELADNKLSKYSAQKGLCLVTKRFIGAHEVEFHHKKPVSLGGTDKYQNLVAIHRDVHKLIHATNTETIEKYRNKLQLNEEQLEKVNKFRKKCNLSNLN